MRRALYLIPACLILLSLPLTLLGQITGEVRLKEDHSPLPGVIVTLKRDGEPKVLAFCRTDDSGRFTLDRATPSEGLWLHFSMLGIAPDSLRIRPGVSHYTMELREATTELHEVTVTAEPIRAEGDTIRYLVSNFAQIQDRSIADVLKRMPGIEVSSSGQIKYQGRSINRFYIEGRDMLGSRYGVASTSINPKDVGSVEVMENHQPIQALRDLAFSHNAAINIRLKEDAKSRWVGTLTLGGGAMDIKPRVTGLWDAKGSLMRFRKRSQLLATARSTNTGETATTLNRRLDLSGMGREDYDLSSPFDLYTGAPSQLDEEVYRRGPSHAVSANFLLGLAREVDLTGQVNYSHRTDLSHSRATRSYFFVDHDKVIESDETGRVEDSRVDLETKMLINRKSLYLEDRLTGGISWRDLSLTTTGTLPNQQQMSLRRGEVDNQLALILRRGEQSYSLDSRVKWQRQPGVLRISREGSDLQQEVGGEMLFSNTSTSLSHSLGAVDLSAKVGLTTLRRTLTSQLTGLDVDLGPTDNALTLRTLQPYLTPTLSLRTEHLEGSLSVPIRWCSYRLSDRGEERRQEQLALAPGLQLDLQATERLRFSGDLSYSDGLSGDEALHSGYLLSSYYLLSRGAELLNRRQSLGGGLRLEYRNPVRALFANVDSRYSRFRSSLTGRRSVVGDYLVTEMSPTATSGDLLTLGGRISKGVTWWRTTLALKSLYTTGRQQILLDESLVGYRFGDLSLSASAASRPTSWMSLTYEIGVGTTREGAEGDKARQRARLTQLLELVLTPHRAWRVEATGHHYYNEITKEVRKHYFLLDLGLVYSPRSRVEVSLTAKNLLNSLAYGYTVLSSLTGQSVSYDIRPRELLASLFMHF